MKHVVTAGAVAAVAAVTVLGSTGIPRATADEKPGPVNTSREVAAATVVVSLDHPVALEAALRIVAAEPVSELGVEGTNFGGALLLSPTAVEDISKVQHYPDSFSAASGAHPMVTRLSIIDATPKEVVQIKRRLNALPAQALQETNSKFQQGIQPGSDLTTPLKDRLRNSGKNGATNGSVSLRSTTSGDAGTVIPNEDLTLDNFENAYPSAVFSEMINILSGDMPYNFSIGFAWDYVPELGILHHTQLWPEDWGLEVGPTLYNSELSELSDRFAALTGVTLTPISSLKHLIRQGTTTDSSLAGIFPSRRNPMLTTKSRSTLAT